MFYSKNTRVLIFLKLAPKHLVFTLAYVGLGIAIIFGYTYSPINMLVDIYFTISLGVLAIAGIFNPMFVMAFSNAIKKDRFRSSFSIILMYTLIGLGCFAQIAFGTYTLIHYGLHAWGAAHDIMHFQMLFWNLSDDTDYLQNYFECCGANDGPSDWLGMVATFRNHAKVRLKVHFFEFPTVLNSNLTPRLNGQLPMDVSNLTIQSFPVNLTVSYSKVLNSFYHKTIKCKDFTTVTETIFGTVDVFNQFLNSIN